MPGGSNAPSTLRYATLAALTLALPSAALLVTAGFAMLGLQNLWAYHYLAYVPVALRLGFALLVVLCAFPFAPHAWRTLERLRLPGWLVVAGAVAIFWLFRERTYSGDALFKLALLAKASLRTDPYVWKEPLDSVVQHLGADVARAWGKPPEVAIALSSVAAGGVYVAAVWFAAPRSGCHLAPPLGVRGCPAGPRQQPALVRPCGELQLGHGHDDAGCALAVGYLRHQAPLWAVGLASGAAVSFHPQAVFALPALLLLLRRPRLGRRLAILFLTGVAVPLATAAVLGGLSAGLPDFTRGYAGDAQLFWTLPQAFAPAQLWDTINNLALVAPLWLLWLVAGVGGWFRAAQRRDPVFRYLTAVAAGFLVYLVFFQNDLPRPRDWDLYAIVGPPLTLWGLYSWLNWLDGARSAPVRAAGRQVLGVGLAFAASVTLLWVGVNATYTLIHPNPDQHAWYERYRLLDLTTLVASATVTPADPICAEPVGCERVALTEFTMPQDGDSRPVIFAHAPAVVAMPLLVPDDPSFLWLSPALDPQTWDWGGDGVTFSVKIRSGGRETLLWQEHVTPTNPVDRDWQQAIIPLDDYRGQAVELLLVTEPGPAGDNAADRAGWGLPWLMRGTYD